MQLTAVGKKGMQGIADVEHENIGMNKLFLQILASTVDDCRNGIGFAPI
jgi:hypothetical protein